VGRVSLQLCWAYVKHYISPELLKTQCSPSRVLEGVIDMRIIFKECAIAGDRILYSFKDAKRTAAEEAGYLENEEKKHNFDPAKYEKKTKPSAS
jgi:hypothetical protein